LIVWSLSKWCYWNENIIYFFLFFRVKFSYLSGKLPCSQRRKIALSGIILHHRSFIWFIITYLFCPHPTFSNIF
jgi:hypothetical protein